MLNYSEIKERKYIVLEGEPYEVLESSIKKKNRQKPANQTKLKNLFNGSVKQVAFHQSDTVEEADINKKTVTYSFSKFNNQTKSTEYWFYEGDDKSKRFSLDFEIIGNQSNYLKENTKIDALTFNNEIIGIKLPVKVDLKVKEAPPNFKGNTASGADKRVILETGASVTVPMFIKTGDTIRVNTETGEYVERV
jgi:elongation factor P